MSFALELALTASEEILPRFPVIAVHHKNDGSVVTEADVAAEKTMRRRIRNTYPSRSVGRARRGNWQWEPSAGA